MSSVQSESDMWRIRAITAFRLGHEGEGSEALVNYIDLIAPLLESHGAQFGSDEAALLQEIIAAQQRGDYLFVADLLEYLLPDTTLAAIGGS